MKSESRKRRAAKQRSAKAGLPPGSLVLIGDVKTEQTRLTILDYGPGGIVETDLTEVAQLRSYRRQHERLWINLYGLQNVALLKAVGEYCGLHPLAVEDMLNTDQRPKLDDYGDTLYIALHRHHVREGKVATDQISLALGKDFILSVQECPSGVLEPVRQRLRADRGVLRAQGSDFLAYALLDVVVDSYFLVTETLSESSDDLEDAILDRPPPATQQRLHELKRQIARLRRNLWPLREVLGRLQHLDTPLIGSAIHPYLGDVQDHIVHLVESLEDLRDLVTGLQDVFLSTVSHRVNLELRALTVVATIFMPATLIAGIFGMNFKVMPWIDNAEGYRYAFGLMGAIAILMLLIFWRRRMV